jgi:small ligand-binding sensory domain FIST
MQWASALSVQSQLSHAFTELKRQLTPALEFGAPDLAIVFFTPYFDAAEIAAQIQRHFGPRYLLGCSASGVIGGAREFESPINQTHIELVPALSLTLAHLPGVEIEPFHLQNDDLPDLDSPPQAWIERLQITPEPAPYFILLANTDFANLPGLLLGLDFAYGPGRTIGGIASFQEDNILLHQGKVMGTGAAGLALKGNITMDTVVAQGCRPIGQPLSITACNTHYLTELDDRQAIEVLSQTYHELTPEDQELLRSNGLFLGIASTEFVEEFNQGDFLIRTVYNIDQTKGAIVIAETLRPGQTVQFHLRDAKTAATDLQTMLQRYQAQDGAPHTAGGLLFTCTGRGQHLYGHPDHDSNLFTSIVGDVPLGGFFCNGEIGPVGPTTYLHGYTSAFGLFRPKKLS